MVMAYVVLKIFILVVCGGILLTGIDGFDGHWHFLLWAAALALTVGILRVGIFL